MRLTRSVARHRAVVALASLALAATAGCSGGGPGSPPGSSDPAVAIEGSGTGIEERLTERTDVAGADVSYRDDIANPASAIVDITMEPGADMEALYEEGVRLVWESEINPLTLIYVNVINPDDPPSGLSRTINLNEGDEREVLEETYGPHPD